MRIVLRQKRNWRGRLQWSFVGKSDGNNKTLFQSETYHNEKDALDTIELICSQARNAHVIVEKRAASQADYHAGAA
jgi:uncharacterized protein YegP (UPF0339 family)